MASQPRRNGNTLPVSHCFLGAVNDGDWVGSIRANATVELLSRLARLRSPDSPVLSLLICLHIILDSLGTAGMTGHPTNRSG
jgi:hypothetical protein